jgi:signal transduction histidine kinase
MTSAVSDYTNLGLRTVLQRCLYIITGILGLAAVFSAAYVTVVNTSRDNERNQNVTHATLLELIKPALAIFDYQEIQRLLGLVTKKDVLFAVVTEQNDILLSDYTKRPQIARLLARSPKIRCVDISGSFVEDEGQQWLVHCTEIEQSETKYLGRSLRTLLVSLRAKPRLGISLTNFAQIMGLLGIILAIAIIYLRKVVSENILRPIEELAESVRTHTSIGLEEKFSEINSKNSAPIEIQALRSSFNNLICSLRTFYEQRREIDRERAYTQIAQRVAHDIRSPLAALNVAMKDLSQMPEDYRLMVRGALNRITDIASDVLRRNPDQRGRTKSGGNQGISVHLLPGLIESIVSEKRLEFRSRANLKIESELGSSYGLFASVEPMEFKRTISNLINNSVEAIESEGRVTVGATSGEDRNAILTVRDHGRGIFAELLPGLMKRGSTHGKNDGSGLGLYHAKTSIESWGGLMTIESENGVGTVVTIRLPRANAPDWFLSQLDLITRQTVVVLDDDSAIHGIWNDRLTPKRTSNQIQIIHFLHTNDLVSWIENNNSKSVLYLLDFELVGSEMTGLDLIERFGLQPNAVLVTSHDDDERVQARCVRLGVKLIPKNMAALVPIKYGRLRST